MATAHDKLMKTNGAPVLLNQFGEPVIYKFRAGGQRPITAIVVRDPPAIYNAAGEVVVPKFTIRFKDDCTKGVRPSEIDTGGDKVALHAEIGDVTRTTVTVMQLVSQDSSFVQLALI